MQCKPSHEKKNSPIFHTILTQLFPELLGAYCICLNPHQCQLKEIQGFLNPESGDLATPLNNRNVTLSCLQKSVVSKFRTFFKKLLSPASLLSFLPPPQIKTMPFPFNYIKFISFKSKNSLCKPAWLAFSLCLYLSQQLQPCSNTKLCVSDTLLPPRCVSR